MRVEGRSAEQSCLRCRPPRFTERATHRRELSSRATRPRHFTAVDPPFAHVAGPRGVRRRRIGAHADLFLRGRAAGRGRWRPCRCRPPNPGPVCSPAACRASSTRPGAAACADRSTRPRRRARRSMCTLPCCRRWRATASRTRCSFSPVGRGRARSRTPAAWRACWARLSNRRDIVLIDQRGTGRSAPLVLRRAEPDAAAGRGRGPGAAVGPPGGLPGPPAEAAARRPAALHHRRRHAGCRCRAPPVRGRRRQRRRRQLRHTRGAGLHAAVSAGRARGP